MPQRFLRPGIPQAMLKPAPRGRAGRDKAEARATQRRFLHEVAPGVPHVIVIDDVANARRMPGLADAPDVVLREAPRSTAGMGEARNLAASVAMDISATLLVKLDAEAVPLPAFLEAYPCAPWRMGSTGGRWLYNGPITYPRRPRRRPVPDVASPSALSSTLSRAMRSLRRATSCPTRITTSSRPTTSP